MMWLGQPLLLLAVAEWVTDLLPLSYHGVACLALGPRMHKSFVIGQTTFPWSRESTNSRVFIESELQMLLLWSPRNPVQNFRMQPEHYDNSEHYEGVSTCTCHTQQDSTHMTLGSFSVLLCHARWLRLTRQTLRCIYMLQPKRSAVISFKTKGKKIK